MTEILVVLTATVIVFALFLLVFFIKGRSGSTDIEKPACAHCNCHREQKHHEGTRRHLKSNAFKA